MSCSQLSPDDHLGGKALAPAELNDLYPVRSARQDWICFFEIDCYDHTGVCFRWQVAFWALESMRDAWCQKTLDIPPAASPTLESSLGQSSKLEWWTFKGVRSSPQSSKCCSTFFCLFWGWIQSLALCCAANLCSVGKAAWSLLVDSGSSHRPQNAWSPVAIIEQLGHCTYVVLKLCDVVSVLCTGKELDADDWLLSCCET